MSKYDTQYQDLVNKIMDAVRASDMFSENENDCFASCTRKLLDALSYIPKNTSKEDLIKEKFYETHTSQFEEVGEDDEGVVFYNPFTDMCVKASLASDNQNIKVRQL